MYIEGNLPGSLRKSIHAIVCFTLQPQYPFVIQLSPFMEFITTDDVCCHGDGVQDQFVHKLLVFLHVEPQWVKGGVCTWFGSLVHYML